MNETADLRIIFLAIIFILIIGYIVLNLCKELTYEGTRL